MQKMQTMKRCQKMTFGVYGLLFLAVFLFQHTLACAKTKDVTTNPDAYFLKADDVVDSMKLLPAPPQPGSAAFEFDEAMYQHGMTLRNTPAGKKAAEDATNTIAQSVATFSDAFGHTISKDATPAIFALSLKVMGDAGGLAPRAAKDAHARIRPFAYHKAATCNPRGQLLVHPRHSYPSGHSAFGWALALVLSEIHPERQNEILRRGLELGQGRVICGYHWQSDVDAGRVLAAAVVARLHANATFMQGLAAAKEEFARLQQTQSNSD